MNGRAEHTSNVVFSYRTGYVQRMHSVPQLITASITAFPPNRFARDVSHGENSKKNTTTEHDQEASDHSPRLRKDYSPRFRIDMQN